MATKPRQTFDWVGVLFLIDLILVVVLLFGSIFGAFSKADFLTTATAAAACYGFTCGVCWRKVRTDPSRNWKPARFITGVGTIGLLALIYINAR
jgi:hypothetical protein